LTRRADVELLAISEDTADALFAAVILGVIALGIVISALWRR
jgi:hypothetical protein